MRELVAVLTVLILAAVALPALAAAPDGLDLTVSRGPAPASVRLNWTGTIPTYSVYRSTNAATVTDPGNSLGDTSGNGIWIAGVAAGYRSPAVGAYLWSAPTGMVPIPNTRHAWGIYPEAVSNDGRTIIGYQGPYGTNYRQAIIWTADGGTEILSQWLTQLGADLSAVNGQLEYAVDMTADGKTIIGVNPSMYLSWAVGAARFSLSQ